MSQSPSAQLRDRAAAEVVETADDDVGKAVVRDRGRVVALGDGHGGGV